MEHQNKKSLLPTFQTAQLAQFTGLNNSGANALMSTLHSMQMHTLGNTILPQPNLSSAEYTQRVLEQMKAVQSMYTSFNKITGEPSVPVSNGVASSSNMGYERNGTSGAKMNSANTIFPNATNFLTNDLHNFANSGMMDQEPSSSHQSTSVGNKNDMHSHQSVQGIDQASLNAFLNQRAVQGLNLQTMNGIANSMLSEEWMKTIQLDKNDMNSEMHIARPQPVIVKPSSSSVHSMGERIIDVDDTMTSKEADNSKDQTDAVEDMFGLSNLDDGVDQSADDSNIFGLPTSGIVNGGLSPVQFTPPDSPTEALTTDFLFGLEPARTNSTPASCSSQPSTSTTAALNNKEDVTCDGFKIPEAPVSETPIATPPPPLREPVYAKKCTKSNKVPVYKQKLNNIAASQQMEAKKGPNFDAFEFEDDDEDESLKPQELKKEEIDVFANCDSNSKNVYVPGIGFAISNEAPVKDLWKHVVPKKRPLVDMRQSAPGTNLLPPSAHHEAEKAARLTDPAIVTLAESIRIRRNQRISCSFLRPSMSNDTECAKTMKVQNPDQPPIPKYAIRITHIFDTAENGATKRKRKKKNSDDDDEDSDWDNAVIRRKRKTAKKIYELIALDSKKEGESNTEYEFQQTRRNGYSEGASTRQNPGRRDHFDSVKHRLSKFGSAEGFLPKGTYVVCKTDLLKEECALWRVDNQNLLQKFPPRLDLSTNRLIYKSSSTYSGWCEQISNQYFRVSVRILKQSRSETSIEPEVPLNELFPAMSEEILKDPRTVHKEETPSTSFDESLLTKDPQRVALHTLMLALLNHALTMDYLQAIQEKNDWTFLRSMTEIERANTDSKTAIQSRIRLDNKYEKLIAKYTRLVVVSSSYHSLTKCQVCGRRKTRKILQFFDRNSYDSSTLQFNKGNDDTDEELEELGFSSLPALDVYSCGRCAKGCEYLHKLHHMRLHLLRICEDKLEAVGTEYREAAPERIVENVKKDRNWIYDIVLSYIEMWKTIKTEYAS